MEYQTINVGSKSSLISGSGNSNDKASKATSPPQLRSVKRNTIMLQQHKTSRHQTSVDRLQKLKEEQEEKDLQYSFSPTIPKKVEDPRVRPPPSPLSRSPQKPNFSVSNTATGPLKLIDRFNVKKKELESNNAFTLTGSGGGMSSSAPTVISEVMSTGTRAEEEREKEQEEVRAQEKLASVQEELLNIKAERDELLLEKSFWLSKFQSDNAKLLQVLISTRDVKIKMLQEIDNVEKEKDRLRSMQLDGLEASLLDRVLHNSPLAEANRSTLPAHLRGRADELHKTLNTLATKCRSNQLEIFDMIVARVEETENHFLSRNDDAVENAIQELKNIASASPGNVLAAVNVGKKYPELMLAALIEKRDNAIREESIRTHGGGDGSGKSGEAKEVKATDDVTKTLMAQNNTLRASVAQLRKKNTEMKVRLTALELAASEAAVEQEHRSQSLAMEQIHSRLQSSNSVSTAAGGGDISTPNANTPKPRMKRGSLVIPAVGGGPSGLPRQEQEQGQARGGQGAGGGSKGMLVEQTDSHGLSVSGALFAANNNHENKTRVNSTTPAALSYSDEGANTSLNQSVQGSAVRYIPPSPSPGPRTRKSIAPDRKTLRGSISRTDNSFDSLPDFVKDMAWNPILAGIDRIAEANPLSAQLPEQVLHSAKKDIAYQARELVAPVLWILGGHDRWESIASRSEPQDEWNSKVCQSVNKCLNAPQVYSELVSVTMLALTYIHSRSANIRHKSPARSDRRNTSALTSKSKDRNNESHDRDTFKEDYHRPQPDYHRPQPAFESKFVSEENNFKYEEEEERDTFDENMFGDSSVLFQSPSHFNHGKQQFTLNPNGASGNPLYMASSSSHY